MFRGSSSNDAWEGDRKLDPGAPVAYFGAHRSLPDLESFRSLCNGLKASVIESSVQAMKESKGKSPRFSVLDVGSGRGGDLAKWCRYRPRLYLGVDASSTSVEEAKLRHQKLVTDGRGGLVASFSTVDVRSDKLPLADGSLDIASLQFSLQYAFDTEAGAVNLIGELSRVLRPGGIVVAIFPDGDRVASILSSSTSSLVSLGHFSFRKFERTTQALENDPPVGIPYSFTLGPRRDGCPEYVVSPAYLHILMEKYGFEELDGSPFSEGAQHYYNRASPHVKGVVSAVLRGRSCSRTDWDTLSAFRVLIARRMK
jgi:SAM-dependent methyltransferase